jgi:hypothetical protein
MPRRILYLFLLTIILLVPLSGGNNTGNGVRTPETTVSFARRAVQGFNMRVWLSTKMTMGLQAWDAQRGSDIPVQPYMGLEYPSGNYIEHLYGAGPWIGGRVNGAIRLEYGYEGNSGFNQFIPEIRHVTREHFWLSAVGASASAAIPDTIGYSGFYFNHHIIVDKKGTDNDGDGNINEDDLDGFDNDGDWNLLTDDVGADGLPDSIEVSCEGTPYNPVLNPDPAQDNYQPASQDHCRPPDAGGNRYYKNDKDIYTEKNGVPDHGEPHVDEDYGALSENDLFCAATDTFSSPAHSYQSIGLKISQKSLAWTSSVADAIIPFEYDYTRTKTDVMRDVYIATFADMDVGPVDVSLYFQHNYAAYDRATQTAYVNNPVDAGSTPLGITFLGASGVQTMNEPIFRWFDLTTVGFPGTDSGMYLQMSGNDSRGQIMEDQNPNILSDCRVFLSIGPYPVFSKGDTLKSYMAFVSGHTIDEMLNNARKAHRIHAHGDFIMPEVTLTDSGPGYPLYLNFSGGKSPYGPVTGYRIYYGFQKGIYSDSIDTQGTFVVLPRPPHWQRLYAVVQAIDAMGNMSAESDEVADVLPSPKGLYVDGNQLDITCTWDSVHSSQLAGYHIYRKSDTDYVFTKITQIPVTGGTYYDTAVRGNRTYTYRVTAVDVDGFESAQSEPASGHLIPPVSPRQFSVAPTALYAYLTWLPNNDVDIAGYNVYRRKGSQTSYTKLNGTLIRSASYLDTTITSADYYNCYYEIEAVDNTEAVSPVATFRAVPPISSNALLVLLDACSLPVTESTSVESLLVRYPHTTNLMPDGIDPANFLDYLNGYATILWLKNCPGTSSSGMINYRWLFQTYVMSGGNLLVMGNNMTSGNSLRNFNFLSSLFGITPFLKIDTVADFTGATGSLGFPDVTVSPSAYSSGFAGIGVVERLTEIPGDRVLYRYLSSTDDGSRAGYPVGVRRVSFAEPLVDARGKAYYFTFPLNALDSVSRVSLLTKVLDDFGQYPTGVLPSDIVPTEYRLSDAYPNPFNPSTVVRVDIPASGKARLSIYDLLGREVLRLADGPVEPGRYEYRWNADGNASGVYFIRLHVDASSRSNKPGYTATKKLVLSK